MKTTAFALAALVGLAAIIIAKASAVAKPSEAAAHVHPAGEDKEIFPGSFGWGSPWGLGWINPWWGW
jgi:hypothetical protein